MTAQYDHDALEQMATDHLWMQFTRQSMQPEGRLPIIAEAQGHHLIDSRGRKLFDGLSGLFTTNVGHGRKRLAEVAKKQIETLDFFPIWSFSHPTAIELADKLADLAPGDLNKVFFASGGGEANETAFKVAKQFWKLQGKPLKTKVISRFSSYHGTPQGALSITGLQNMKAPFEPLLPSFRVPNTNFYRANEQTGAPSDDLEAFGLWAADRIEEMIVMEGPDTVAAVFLEPVQNAGGCFTPPPGYFQRVRAICDKYDVLLVADEVICGFGRIGNWFASLTYDFQPDMISCAKAITSGYVPQAATIISDRIYEPFSKGTTMFPHGYTFAGHPVASAVALENIAIFEEEKLNENVQQNSAAFRAELEKLLALPIVGDVRGDGYFFAIELVADKAKKTRFTAEQREKLIRGYLPNAMLEAGLYARADDRQDSVVTLAPPLTIGPAEFTELRQMLETVLTEAPNHI